MPVNPSTPRSHLLHSDGCIALLTGLAMFMGGCGDDNIMGGEDIRRVLVRPSLDAVSTPDSAATGDSVDVIVHVTGGGCTSPRPLQIVTVGPRHLRAYVFMQKLEGPVICPGMTSRTAITGRLVLGEPGTWILEVLGADSAHVAIEVGSGPSVAGVHRFRIEPRDPGVTIPSEIEVWEAVPRVVPVASSGEGEYLLPCGSGSDTGRNLIVYPSSGSYSFASRANDCGGNLSTRFFR